MRLVYSAIEVYLLVHHYRRPNQKQIISNYLSKFFRPAIVITENAVTSNHYFNRKEDIEMARFTAIPYALIDRRDLNDIQKEDFLF